MSLDSLTVSDFMSQNVKTGKEFQSVREISKMMKDNNVGSIIIIANDNKPIAIVTERDIVNEIASSDTFSANTPISKLMGKRLIGIDESSTLEEAVNMMRLNDVRRLAVMKAGSLSGIITEKDVFRALTKELNLSSDIVKSLS
ncbi:MAG: cyclic nucleotide-binding/CBS domain-containing protein [Candidatus Eiseniibacteriota bacterium]